MLLIGPPGAGKGTQATYIAKRFGIVSISTGDIFRENVKNETRLGQTAKSYLDAGQFVPDAVTNAMVRERLEQNDVDNGFLLDGYPRTLGQVDYLDEILAAKGYELDLVLQLTAETEELVQRLLLRAERQNRSDDTAEVIRSRMELYFEQTTAVTSRYNERGIVTEVEGLGSISEVSGRVSTTLDLMLGWSSGQTTVAAGRGLERTLLV
ncbi:adenylate kinase [Arthrobacter sp. ISL-65]|uniref:adenylate kinase n=1 Tax=Arthrobacter sp. ISL-65 TaxID=2819112 RepID=UPI001BEB6894|nr:adenylate kinase [Arthrobacter sp. ISL-65]MBT2550238.1 adenylate kinase [Arthrobacter sp. ISL-65]